MTRLSFVLFSTTLLVLECIALFAQEVPHGITPEDLAKNNKLFIELATKALHWDEPTDPVKIVGPLYFVGTRGLSSWLFVTSEGNILLNTGTPKSGPMIVESIHKLGFKPEDIKIIINGHGHSDHAGSIAYMKQLTGAQIAIMQPDVPMVEDGGKSDFHYGKDWQIMGQPPVKVDRILRSGDVVRLGDVVLTGFNTPGHTKGATTWMTTLVDGGKAYKVVFPDGAGFNPGYQIANPEEYPGINQDYRDTLHFLESLRPDIWLAHHTEYFDLEGKCKRAVTEGVSAWVDPEGYRRWVASKRRAFEDEVDKEIGLKSQSGPMSAPQSLAGTNWQLVKFQGGDGKTLVPDDKSNYQVNFMNESEVAVRIDCNRGHGTWKSQGPQQIEFGPLALTRAMCPPAPLSDRLAKDWSYIRSYILKDGHLFVSLMADSGVYEFEPQVSSAGNKSQKPDILGLPATFVGTLPCADCPGIRYQVNLFPDQTFVSRMTYEERNSAFDDSGHWQVLDKGQTLALRGGHETTARFRLRDHATLRKLDANGNEIASKLNYDLKRAPTFSSIEPPGKDISH